MLNNGTIGTFIMDAAADLSDESNMDVRPLLLAI